MKLFGRKKPPGPADAPPRKARVKLEKHAQIARKVDIFVEEPVRIDAHIMMRSGFIGAYSYARQGARIGPWTSSIGRYCSIAPGAAIGDGQHPLDWLSTHPFQKAESFWFDGELPRGLHSPRRGAPPRTYIGNDVWIGTNAVLMSDCVIGDGAVIAAGAIVTRSVPPYAIVAGVPARIMRFRFPPDIIRELQDLRWWRFNADDLATVRFDNVPAAITEIRRRETEGTLREMEPIVTRLTYQAQEPVTESGTLRRIRSTYRDACTRTAALLPPES